MTTTRRLTVDAVLKMATAAAQKHVDASPGDRKANADLKAAIAATWELVKGRLGSSESVGSSDSDVSSAGTVGSVGVAVSSCSSVGRPVSVGAVVGSIGARVSSGVGAGVSVLGDGTGVAARESAFPPLPLFFPFLSDFPFEFPPPLPGFPFLPFGDFDLPPVEADADAEIFESLCEKAWFGRNPIEVARTTARTNVSALWVIRA